MAQKEDFLAKFHATREKHDQDLTQVSLLKSLCFSIVPDHLPEDGTDAKKYRPSRMKRQAERTKHLSVPAPESTKGT